jgi:transposase InsO family protein
MDETDRKKIAMWRLSVLGPLISARLVHGDRRQLFAEAAARVHQRPDGRLLELSARTVEAWYYAYQQGGFEALYPKVRSDRGRSRALAPEVAERIIACKREKPRRSIRRIIRMLERAKVVRIGELSRSTVHRLLCAHGISARPVRGPQAERRSFLMEHAGDLCVGDALHVRAPVIAPDGRLRKAYLLSQIDGATRYILHSYFALSEGAVDQERGFREAILKHGPPRAYYVDRGAAYVATSLQMICAELGIRLMHTEAGDAPAKGVIERWHRTWREEVEDELPKEPIPLAELCAKHWAWLGAEYHARKHETTDRVPREHFLSEVEHLRTLPHGKNLFEVFLHREPRKVRQDGTVRFRGAYLEVRPELVGKTVELRYDPTDDSARPQVFFRDRFVCDTVPLDRYANATRRRRRDLGQPEPTAPSSGLDPLALIEAEHYERVRPVGKRPTATAILLDGEEDDIDPDSED